MNDLSWTKEFPGSVTLCDTAGVILQMNDASASLFAKYGGRDLIGRNLLDCHPEPSRSKLAEMLATGRANAYTIRKNGAKKLIYQSPWYEQGQYRGLVEIALSLPDEVPHFDRDTQEPGQPNNP